jgi:TRAP-type mannitol/chloroaromatic compound transport system permease small subunit
MLVTILYEVIARYIFSAPTRWVMEYNGYFFGSYCLLAGGYTLLNKAHVNVDILYGRFNYRTKAIIDCFTWLLFFVFVGTVGYLGCKLAYEAFVRNETSGTVLNTPIFPMRAVIPAASILILFQGVAKIIKDIDTAVTGKEPKDLEAGGILGRLGKKG